MIALLVTTAAVVFISAACSLCEAVLYSVPAAHIESLQADGSRVGQVLAALRERVDAPITAILTLNTIANTAGAAIAGGLATHALGEGNVYLFSAALTGAILFFSEILPKTFGVVYSRMLATWVAYPLRALVVVFWPFIFVISAVTRLISAGRDEEGVSHEELVSLTRLGTRQGTIDADEAAVIQNILNLSSTEARSVMTPRTVVFALPADASLSEVLDEPGLMVHSRIPVYGEELDEIVGLVFRRDVLAAEPETLATISTLIRPVAFVVESETVDDVLELLLEHQQHMLVVMDEFGGFAGVITLEDVMEEILGKEIVDEFDQVEDMRQLAHERRAAALERMKRSGRRRSKTPTHRR